MEKPIKMDDLGVPLFLETPWLKCPVALGPFCFPQDEGTVDDSEEPMDEDPPPEHAVGPLAVRDRGTHCLVNPKVVVKSKGMS